MNIINLCFKNYKKMPWKNGLGTTFEVDISPVDAALDQMNFDFRISLAQVSSENSFSNFSGMERFLTVIRGSGIKFNQEKILPFCIVHFLGEEKVMSGPVV